jgi:hypothetical protein
MSSFGTGSTSFRFNEGGVLPNPTVTGTDFGKGQFSMVLNQKAGSKRSRASKKRRQTKRRQPKRRRTRYYTPMNI